MAWYQTGDNPILWHVHASNMCTIQIWSEEVVSLIINMRYRGNPVQLPRSNRKVVCLVTPGTLLPAVGSGAPVCSIEKNDRLSAFAKLIAIFNNDSSLPTFTTTVLTCAGHFFRIVPVSVFRVATKNTVFMTYPMHNWAPYWLFTIVYACVPHFNLWRGLKHPCSFQLRIALNLKSTRHYMGIDLVPYVKSHTSARHNCKIQEVFLADCWLFRCIVLNIGDWCIRW